MTLLENEVQLDALHSVRLSNYRITQEFGSSYKISIFLEKISSVVVLYKSKPLLLLLGLILIAAGFYFLDQSDDIEQIMGGVSLGVGVILIIAFFVTRKHVLTISPDGGMSLDASVKGVSNERIEEFITKIQEAKQTKISITTT